MADRGILFSAPMVKALLAGRKTQTRRLIKPCLWPEEVEPPYVAPYPQGARAVWCDPMDCSVHVLPSSAVGDRLWVREAWFTWGIFDDLKPSLLTGKEGISFEADRRANAGPRGGRLRPGMFMPRWASRITLTVTEIRVQRLQDITEADAEAEGCVWDSADGLDVWYVPSGGLSRHGATARECYGLLWDTLHAKPGERWEDNPWVVATSFTIEQRNIGAVQA